jgi:hypothetical protein
MRGCAGKVVKASASALCQTGWHVCTSSEWVANRGQAAPAHHYWTSDTLLYNGSGPGNCWVSTSTGNSCGSGSSMLVCKPTITDPEGNTCNETDCGLNVSTPDEMFGGCPGTAAGALCCQ